MPLMHRILWQFAPEVAVMTLLPSPGPPGCHPLGMRLETGTRPPAADFAIGIAPWDHPPIPRPPRAIQYPFRLPKYALKLIFSMTYI